ncbi:MAG: TolC family protein [Syntrophaceae bacterium]|nr:TolC family protein [Syntrophaceae bacterium]
MKAKLISSLCLAMLLSGVAGAQNPIRPGETLDLERCISIAISRHPSAQASAGAVAVVESRVGQARSGYYPLLSGSAGYSRADSTSTAGGQSYNNYSSRLSLSQNLYDFGKTATQIKVQELSRDASQADLEYVHNQIVLGVKQAYFTLLQAEGNRAVLRETVAQYQFQLDQAQAFFTIGIKPKYDVTTAEVNLSTAKLNLLKGENTLRLAQVALNNAIGLPGAPEYAIADRLSGERLPIDMEAMLRKAYERRSDLKALAVKKLSLEQSIELAKKGYMPSLTGSASYGWGGGSFPLEQSWSVGAQVSVPLFNNSTRYQVNEAMANLEIVKANEAALQQAISQEVKQACLNLQEAVDRIANTELTTRQADENLSLAQGRYKAGVGNPIEVTNALVALSSTKSAHVTALYDYELAKASLEKASGEQ